MTDLRFPVGKFSYAGPPTDAQKQAFLNDIAQTPANLRAAVNGLSETQLDTPYRPEGWTVRQVVHHVPDSHMNSYVRFKLALTEDEPTIKPYAEDRWAQLADSKAPIEVSLTLLDSLHDRWVRLLRSLSAEDWQRTFRHPDMGTMTLEKALAMYSWHGRHHVAHITELKKSRGWEENRRGARPLPDSHAPQQITGSLAQHRDRSLHCAVRARVGPGCDIDRANAFVLQQFANAKNVVGIADRNTAVQAVRSHNHGDALG